MKNGIIFNTRVLGASYSEAAKQWRIATDLRGELIAPFCIMATGCLSTPRIPDFAGLQNFEKPVYHTADWPEHGVDFTGQTVGCIGTGSTGIQAIPMIAQQAAKLYVFQRTANFSVPAHNRDLDQSRADELRANYASYRQEARKSFFGVPFPANLVSALSVTAEEREREYERRWGIGGGAPFLNAYMDLLTNKEANDTIADFVRRKIRSIVKDPLVAGLLTPTDHPLGTKRICVDTNYYDTFNRKNVELIDVKSSPIVEITASGVRTATGLYELDSLVLATGFDAMTGALLAIDIRGKGGVALKDKWAGGPRCYLGIMAAGFPNLFIVTGPGSPSVLSNMVVSIEQHVNWTVDCIVHMRQAGYRSISPTKASEDQWVGHADAVANMTLFPQANSWYVGANVPGKPRTFMPYVGGVGAYADICDEVAAGGYVSFEFH